jgi:DNA-directed RNA polymerase specialized sigma24 family protein
MTLEEIAESLQMNLGTVKSALHRAVRRLRETLEGVRA